MDRARHQYAMELIKGRVPDCKVPETEAESVAFMERVAESRERRRLEFEAHVRQQLADMQRWIDHTHHPDDRENMQRVHDRLTELLDRS